MDEIKGIVIKFGLALGLIFGLTYFLKHNDKVSVQAGERVMNEAAFPEGSYAIDTTVQNVSGFKRGDVVAYVLPGDSARRLARVAGTEGQRIAINDKSITVDGQPFGFRVELDARASLPEFKIPRGCAYLLADFPFNASDSIKNGPIPFSQILGTVKPVK